MRRYLNTLSVVILYVLSSGSLAQCNAQVLESTNASTNAGGDSKEYIYEANQRFLNRCLEPELYVDTSTIHFGDILYVKMVFHNDTKESMYIPSLQAPMLLDFHWNGKDWRWNQQKESDLLSIGFVPFYQAIEPGDTDIRFLTIRVPPICHRTRASISSLAWDSSEFWKEFVESFFVSQDTPTTLIITFPWGRDPKTMSLTIEHPGRYELHAMSSLRVDRTIELETVTLRTALPHRWDRIACVEAFPKEDETNVLCGKAFSRLLHLEGLFYRIFLAETEQDQEIAIEKFLGLLSALPMIERQALALHTRLSLGVCSDNDDFIPTTDEIFILRRSDQKIRELSTTAKSMLLKSLKDILCSDEPHAY